MTQPTTPREKVELKPCPFCGGPAERVTIMSRVGVRCADALCAGSHRLPTEGEDSAALWNQRTTLASGSGDHAELKAVAWMRVTNGEVTHLSHLQHGPGYSPLVPAASVKALTAENAALRGADERTGELLAESNLRESRATVRATEAERKLAEARGLLEPFALLASDEHQSGANMNDPLSKWFTIAQIQNAHRFLSSTEAERG